MPPAKSTDIVATAALTIVQNTIFMLMSSDVIAVYRHMPHMIKADKAIKMYKMNFMFLPPIYILPATITRGNSRHVIITIQPFTPFVRIYQFRAKGIAIG